MESDRLVIYPRRSLLFFSSVSWLIWAGLTLPLLMLTPDANESELLLYVLNFFFCVLIVPWSLYRLVMPIPILIIGQDGVLVHVLIRRFAKWTEIKEYGVTYEGRAGKVLTVERTDGKKMLVTQFLCPMKLELVQDFLSSQIQRHRGSVS